jgi:predicted nucleotidyltransferase
MSTSNQSYKELAIPYFKEVFEIIDEIMQKHQIPYYLIGVNAIALELLKEGIKPSRGTKDIDFAVMISSGEDYKKITKDLEEKGFAKVKAPWTFYNKSFNAVIDVLPFGEIEQEFTQNFDKRQIDLHVVGLKEVLEDSREVYIDEKLVQIPPLPGMLILKLVAWSDRPEDRGQDPGDILKIIKHYFDYNFDEILEEHNDIFPEGELNETGKLKIAARVLGRNARKYVKASERLEKKVLEILEEHTSSAASSDFLKKWASQEDWDLDLAQEILFEFKTGITE